MRTCFSAAALLMLMHLNTLAAIPLWPAGAPGAHGSAPADVPTITQYLPAPEKATGAALLICPGGGYEGLAPYEGEAYARFFNQYGIAGFVLTYRLASNGYHYPAMFQDVTRAMRCVRAHAADWHVDPHRIGIIGSSAGGHLASMLLTHFDSGKPDDPDPVERQSSRPDLGILCYPVITMMGPDTNAGSQAALLGPNPAPGLAKLLSTELQVTSNTPSCFIFQTWEDPTVKVENSLMFAAALRAHGIPFDLHIYQHGGHGMGLGGPWDQPEKLHPWTRDCIYWLKFHNFVK
ncbi:MAG TPA: alpha/beta hydrolase [Chthoniobacteraceae bacterium]|nr:alpha/beta hydrolase [Chthoniobacteraceae bacterium]